MAEVEQGPDVVRQLLQTKLAQVPAEAARVSGPRIEGKDISYLVWQKVKKNYNSDPEEPLTLSQWKQKINPPAGSYNYMTEFESKLAECTDTQYHHKMCLNDKKIRPMNRYSDILAFAHSRVQLVERASMQGFREYEDSYINANFVDGPLAVGDRKIIASQGPLDNTF